jgi:hypothetical protein
VCHQVSIDLVTLRNVTKRYEPFVLFFKGIIFNCDQRLKEPQLVVSPRGINCLEISFGNIREEL